MVVIVDWLMVGHGWIAEGYGGLPGDSRRSQGTRRGREFEGGRRRG